MALSERERAAFEQITERLLAEDPDFGRPPLSQCAAVVIGACVSVCAAVLAAAATQDIGAGISTGVIVALAASATIASWRWLQQR